MVEYPVLKIIGASSSQNTSDTSSRKVCEKDIVDKPVYYQGDDYIASHQKSMFLVQSHLGQEEGRTTMVAAPALKMIGNLRSQNTSDTSFRKECKEGGANKPVRDEGDDSIASHHKYMFLIRSNIGQEEGRTKMLDNLLMADPAQVSQNTMVSIAPPNTSK